MIKNLDSVTSQLRELSTTINSFKSEAVQVRLIELLLSGKSIAADVAPAAKTSAPTVAKAKDGRGRPKKITTATSSVPVAAAAKVVAPAPAAAKPAAAPVAKAKGKRGRPKATATVAPKAAPVAAAAKVVAPAAKPAKATKLAKAVKPAKAAKPAKVAAPKAAKPAKASANGESRGRGRASLNGKPGASKVLNSLLTTKFFNQKRTMTDILKHCAEKLNSPFKSNEVSGILTKLVRDEKLIREKSPKTGNFEYNLKVS